MNHEALQRKLTYLEEEIRAAQAASVQGTVMLSRVALSLDDAIRVAANIRNRLAGVSRPVATQSYHVGRRSVEIAGSDDGGPCPT